jgi:branched chain amino acid efflux pump
VSAAWITVVALCVGTIAIKAAGPVALGGRRPSARSLAVIALVAPAVLSGLVTYETLSAGTRGIAVDARVVGLAVAAAGALLRVPMIVVVVAAAAATALARAVA